MTDEKKCTFNGQQHMNGTEICDNFRCLKCRDGWWDEGNSDLYPPSA